MSEYTNLLIAVEERIATLTINRPAALNALNSQTLEELNRAFNRWETDGQTGAVIVTGAGPKAFVAGADISEFKNLTPLEATELARRGQAVFDRIARFPKPVIAAINGFCLGGGCELALACHLRIASEEAQLGQPEVRLGIIPGYGGTQRLSRLVGAGRALELIVTGERMTAREALAIGLVNRVVPGSELLPVCREMAHKILTNAPLAVRYAMQAVQSGAEMPLAEGQHLEANLFGLCFATEDAREGAAAFLEKRKPQFKGK